MNEATTLESEIDDWDGTEAQKLREARARRSYLEHALSQILAKPLAVHKARSSICVIVFGRIAFLNQGGALSVAEHDQGVLSDPGFDLLEQIEWLPVAPTSAGIRAIASYAIFSEAARSMAAWSGEIVDIRAYQDSDWSLEPRSKADESFSFLELSAKEVVGLVPNRIWTKIARDFSKLLELDRSLLRASKWAILGAYSPLDAYERLRRSGMPPFTVDSGGQRATASNAISAAIEGSEEHQDLGSAVKSFQSRLSISGVTRSGWQLLLASELRYWRNVFPLREYDRGIAAISLVIGQNLLPPRLPDPKFVHLIHGIDLDDGLCDRLRHIPPQIWRRAYEHFEHSSERAMYEIREVIHWAAALGAGMPKTVRNAAWQTLLRRATDHLVVETFTDPGFCTPQRPIRFECGDASLFELTTERSVQTIARLMSNCLGGMWPEIQSGAVKIFFAILDSERAAIALRRRSNGGEWFVDEIKGPSNKSPDRRFREIAARLCSTISKF